MPITKMAFVKKEAKKSADRNKARLFTSITALVDISMKTSKANKQNNAAKPAIFDGAGLLSNSQSASERRLIVSSQKLIAATAA